MEFILATPLTSATGILKLLLLFQVSVEYIRLVNIFMKVATGIFYSVVQIYMQ